MFGKTTRKPEARAEEVPGATGTGKVRTDLDCHNCSKVFVALLDFDVDGCHRVGCPHCGHTHYRVIKQGVITGDRWNGKQDLVIVAPGSVWKSETVDMVTNTAALYMRDLWLQRGVGEGAL